MFKKNLSFLMLSFLSLFVVLNLTPAWSANEDALGRQAEQAGKLRQALKHYVSALQSTSEGSSKDRQLREKIIRLALRIKPLPAVQEEAERRMARGRAAVKAAKDQRGFLRAANEFKKAVWVAPWLAEGYYNLGVVQDKAGRYDDAIRNLKLYMLAAPDAPDIKQVRNIIYEIEYRKEEAKRQRQEERRQQAKLQIEREAKASRSIAGKWLLAPNKWPYRITVDGNIFRAEEIEKSVEGVQFEGTINGNRLQGEALMDLTFYENGRTHTRTMTGTISPDRNTIRLRYRGIRAEEVRGRRIIGPYDYDAEDVFVRE